MIQKTLNNFWQAANGKTFFAALVVYIFFGAVVMPAGAKKVSEVSRKKVEILDLQFSYSPEMARHIISEYSDSGRKYAIQFGLIADTFYPISYTFLFVVLTAWIFKAIDPIKFKRVLLLPLVIPVVDYGENLNIALLMYGYPQLHDWQVHLSSLFTSLKWILVVLQVLVIVGALLWLICKKLSKKSTIA